MRARDPQIIIAIFAAVLFFWTSRASHAEALPEGVSQPLTLAPHAKNERNSEGDFIHLRDGRVLFVYTHFTGEVAGHGAAALMSRVSTDQGKSWSNEDGTVVGPAMHGAANIRSVSLLRLKDGRIALFYLVEQGKEDCRLVMRTSSDETQTWSEPHACTEEGFYTVTNGRAVQLDNGRIIFPTAKREATPEGFERGVAMCFFSDDAGVTWHRSTTRLEAPGNSHSGMKEPVIVELKDHRLMMLLCIHLKPQYRSFSSDGGDTWSTAEPTELLCPVAPASLKRIPRTGDLLLVWNDQSKADKALKGKRTPLTVAISSDEGKSWTHRRNVFSDPEGSYSYTAIDFAEDRVLLGMCAAVRARGPAAMATTVITSMAVDWLYQEVP